MAEETKTEAPIQPQAVAKTADPNGFTMRVKVYSPFKVYYDADANSISAENDTGPFDILARHKNFMTLVHPCELVIRAEGKEDFKIRITRAIMHIKADEVTVFLDV